MNRGDLSLEGINEAWQKALDDFELYGPPGSVSMRVFSRSGEQARLTLPMDCVDAEIFFYLLAWLLEWSDLPLSSWNEPKIKGSFMAADPARRLKYLFDFTIEHQPLSEGLFSWRLDLKFERNHVACLSSPPKRESSADFHLDAHCSPGHGNDKHLSGENK